VVNITPLGFDVTHRRGAAAAEAYASPAFGLVLEAEFGQPDTVLSPDHLVVVGTVRIMSIPDIFEHGPRSIGSDS
jgi:hypothetical protein